MLDQLVEKYKQDETSRATNEPSRASYRAASFLSSPTGKRHARRRSYEHRGRGQCRGQGWCNGGRHGARRRPRLLSYWVEAGGQLTCRMPRGTKAKGDADKAWSSMEEVGGAQTVLSLDVTICTLPFPIFMEVLPLCPFPSCWGSPSRHLSPHLSLPSFSSPTYADLSMVFCICSI
jgi:hypothetical protein